MSLLCLHLKSYSYEYHTEKTFSVTISFLPLRNLIGRFYYFFSPGWEHLWQHWMIWRRLCVPPLLLCSTSAPYHRSIRRIHLRTPYRCRPINPRYRRPRHPPTITVAFKHLIFLTVDRTTRTNLHLNLRWIIIFVKKSINYSYDVIFFLINIKLYYLN